jgi:hypothetical protein
MADALDQEHPDALAISLLNVFLGWTCVGWVAALVWARTESPVEMHVARRYRDDFLNGTTSPRGRAV